MIISVSRRTDIPAFYSEWFFNRLNEGYVLTINPFNTHMVHRVSLAKEDVTCFVFWTKNAIPFMEYLDRLKSYNYYFQYTINSYEKDLEPFVPNKNLLVKNFIDLSKQIGKDKVIWRYDPIIITDKYTKEYHYKWFEELCLRLNNYTDKCIISFVDMYNKTKRNTKNINIIQIDEKEMIEIACNLSQIAKKYNLILETCSEMIDLSNYNIKHGKCIDDKLISKIINDPLFSEEKDKYQRKECGCVSSVDIGIYNTCLHQCSYCYANFNNKIINENTNKHNPKSPLLLGEVNEKMKIYEKKTRKIIQQKLF